MNDDRESFARVRELFDELVDLDAAARDARLTEIRKESGDIHRQLTALLGDEEATPRIDEREQALEAMAADPGRALGSPGTDEELETGAAVGPYRILGPLGEGGMGRVYEAEQSEPVVRRAAVKVLRSGVGSRQVLARFDAERQTLAVMDHPNISRMYDAGVTEAGRPWFAMELVAGVAVTEWADDHGLDLDQRIELLLPVCDAIQHSHHKGVIHRDLKPSNVLVAEDGAGAPVPKIIDFGIAKAIDKPLVARTLATRFGELVGTPEYMSPEQASLGAVDVDARSDIYALGLILYKLLVGELPLPAESLRALAFDEICRRIREEDTPRPSTRLVGGETPPATLGSDRRTWSRRVRTDLDAVVLKALAKDRDRRYESAAAFADDLRRFLRDEAVEAAAPSLRYRAGKFVRRHRTAVAAAAITVVALFSGLVAAGYGLVQARRAEAQAVSERDRAEAARRTSEETTDFVVGMFSAADPRNHPGVEVTAGELLGRGIERVDELESEPAVQARMLETLGEVSWSLGEFDRAEELLGRALTLRRHSAPDARREAQALDRLGGIHRDRAELDEAEAAHREAIELLESAGLSESVEMGGALNKLAIVLRRQEKLDEAVETLERAIALTELLEEPPSGNLATSLANLGAVRHSSGDPEAALAAFQRSLAVFEELLPENHPNLATMHNNIALIQRNLGRLAEAHSNSERALAIDRVALPEDHAGIADDLHGLGSVAWRLGDFDAARAAFEEGLAILESAVGANNFRTTPHRGSLGSVELAAGNPQAALSHLDGALEILEGSDDPRAGRHSIGYLRQKALALRALGRLDDASVAVERAIRLAAEIERADDQARLELVGALIALDRDRIDAAKARFDAAVLRAGCSLDAPCALDDASTQPLRAGWYARTGDTGAAFTNLRFAVDGQGWTAWMLEAADLEPLVDHPHWQRIVEALSDRSRLP